MSDTYSCHVNLLESSDWQRSNAETFNKILQKKQDWYETNHCEFWNNWMSDVFDITTATEFGLSVWSIILDEKIYTVTQPSDPTYPAFGFGANRKNFGNGNFGSTDGGTFPLTIEQSRIVLLLKAYILHMSGPARDINVALSRIFGEKSITCIDNLDMSFTYIVYDIELSGFAAELFNRDLLPRPAGIDVSVVLNANITPWGFGTKRKNFNNGNFNAGIIAGG